MTDIETDPFGRPGRRHLTKNVPMDDSPPQFHGGNFMIGWTPAWTSRGDGDPTAVKVGRWPDDRTSWSDDYRCTSGCCNSHFTEKADDEKRSALIGLFFQLVLQDEMSPFVVHREFWKIDIWRDLRVETCSGNWIAFQPDGRCGLYNP